MPDVELQIVCCGAALLERYGNVSSVVKTQGYSIAAECWSTIEGANLVTSAKETGVLLQDLSATLARLAPDVAVVCADRHEVLAAAQAASYQHIPVVHLQGGEISGSIDDKVRDAITHLSDYHCVATKRAAMRVYGLTGDYARVFNTGCPSIDLAKQALSEPPVTCPELGGVGPDVDLSKPFLVVLQHSVTSEADQAGEQMRITLEAIAEVPLPRVVFWSGQDAGADAMAKEIRSVRERHPTQTFHAVRSLPPIRFLKLLTQCSVLVGNSSASVREGSYLGVPAVVVGGRQYGRERGLNVIDVGHDVKAIKTAIERQVAHGPYRSDNRYGDGTAGARIARVIAEIKEEGIQPRIREASSR
jgi:UDP-hydrolysing UDP-N-acetyl-D-glucosamine 2-epimerase